MSSKKLSSQELSEGLVGDENVVLNFLFKNYAPKVVAHAVRLGGDEDDGVELFQQIVLKVREAILTKKYIEEDKFERYFFKTMKLYGQNMLRRIIKRKSNIASGDFESLTEAIKDESEEALTWYMLHEKQHTIIDTALATWQNIACKQMVELRYKQEMALKEIALVMRLSEGYVRRRIGECVELLTNIIFEKLAK